jgi:DNA/RNA endonuclease YhcR with UshA esterase domain
MLMLLLALAVGAQPIRADDASAKPITPAEAAKKVGEKVTMEMEVKSLGGRGPYFLNSEADYKDAKNFTVFIPTDAVEKFKKANIDDPSSHFKGKTVRVTGTVSLYREKPQIKVEDPEQIKIVETEKK